MTAVWLLRACAVAMLAACAAMPDKTWSALLLLGGIYWLVVAEITKAEVRR